MFHLCPDTTYWNLDKARRDMPFAFNSLASLILSQFSSLKDLPPEIPIPNVLKILINDGKNI